MRIDSKQESGMERSLERYVKRLSGPAISGICRLLLLDLISLDSFVVELGLSSFRRPGWFRVLVQRQWHGCPG